MVGFIFVRKRVKNLTLEVNVCKNQVCMINSERPFEGTGSTPSSPDSIEAFFLSHLNRVYCLKHHLIERLPELAEQANFNDLQLAITKTWEDIQRQTSRIDEIFMLLKGEPSVASCQDMIGMVEDAFSDIHINTVNPMLRDLCILYYMTNMESLETASFQILRRVAIKLGNQEVIQRLQENIDESKADRALMLLITTNILNNSYD
jgi:ferritin-like metal-binding protein YciE